ncbi:DUF4349 domain-containing protein [Nostocoides sp. Soil756]|uniref:DUF4349 domain-containing protein n=1 Tax=Nostocoides sp. Soil756 TaxID=1736399 RepID=UPI0006FC3B4B|nr:DUF4349 domain-containing protein [Tetrasphaera sp. Soil756]KRE62955.1 hypothetical protein ASG78_08360 [Tetrasphaera sp. Soil756]
MRPLTRHPSRPSRLVGVALAGSLALVAATACGAGGDSSSASGGQAAPPAQSRADLADTGAAAAPDAVDKAAGTAKGATAERASVLPDVADRKLARRADIGLRVKDVSAAAARLRDIAAAAGGIVVAEQVSSDPEAPVEPGPSVDPAPTDLPKEPATPVPAPGYGTVTISVPAERLDATLDQVATIGSVLSRRTSTDDVTARYVDTASRVATMKASVERVRALMSRADKLADVVTLEAELSRRQADLEAMEQQLAALDDQVALAPISVSLSTAATPVTTEDTTGFLAGLAAGWSAFTTSVRVLLTLLGALLPFAVALALVLVPVGYWWRRRRSGVVPVAVPPTTPAG